jgi:Arc/MetJ-type ribon-helix-helix transcriptional regulator
MRRSDRPNPSANPAAQPSGRLSLSLTPQQLSQVRRLVDAGEFASTAAVVREALRAWLHRRALHGGEHGAQRLRRSFEARQDFAPAEPCERVELLFDAGDAKA